MSAAISFTSDTLSNLHTSGIQIIMFTNTGDGEEVGNRVLRSGDQAMHCMPQPRLEAIAKPCTAPSATEATWPLTGTSVGCRTIVLPVFTPSMPLMLFPHTKSSPLSDTAAVDVGPQAICIQPLESFEAHSKAS
jgi:hypothetical protein